MLAIKQFFIYILKCAVPISSLLLSFIYKIPKPLKLNYKIMETEIVYERYYNAKLDSLCPLKEGEKGWKWLSIVNC